MRIRKRHLLQLCAVVFTPLLMISMLAKPSFATAVVTPSSVYDDFEEILLKPEADAYWWIINWFGDNTLPDGRVEDYCSNYSCVLADAQGNNDFANLALYPNIVEGYYVNAEISEERTGYAYGDPAGWMPTWRHPVIVEARVKWDGDFNQDGSGDAIGTNGVWLWNSPPDLASGEFKPMVSMGFSWNNDDSAIAKGLAATVMRLGLPVGIRKPLFNVDMDDWVTLKMKWERDLLGTQTVHFWINGCWIGSELLQIPITEPLSFTIWHDNQTYGLLNTTFESPSVEQNFLVDYVDIQQL